MYYIGAEVGESYLELNQSDLKFFTTYTSQQLKSLFSTLDKLELVYRLRTLATPSRPQLSWTIKQIFSFEQRNHLTLRLLCTS